MTLIAEFAQITPDVSLMPLELNDAFVIQDSFLTQLLEDAIQE